MSKPLFDSLYARNPELAKKLHGLLDEIEEQTAVVARQKPQPPPSLLRVYYNKTKKIAEAVILVGIRGYIVLMILGLFLWLIAGFFRACGAFFGPLPPD